MRPSRQVEAIAWALGAGSQPIDLVQPDMSAATVVMASGGYPGRYPKGKRIDGIGVANERADVQVYHAGTQLQAGELVTSGGRVLSVTGLAPSLDEALQVAYAGVECVAFDGHQYRRDIGRTET